MGQRPRWMFLAALGATLGAMLLLVPTASASLTTPPPGLVALEQKMEALQLSAVRVSFHEEVRLSTAFAHGGRSRSLSSSHGVVEVGFKDHVARLEYTSGKRHVSALLVGGFLYVGGAWLARIDGGKPWVKLAPPKHPPARLNLGPKLLDDGPTFALLRETLTGARSVTEDGMATIKGQQTVHFTARFTSPGRVIGGPPSHNIPETGTLQLFITPAGLPVKTIGVADNGLTAMTTVSNLGGINFTIVVKAPPARLTISERALRRIERRRAEHRKRHPKIVVIK